MSYPMIAAVCLTAALVSACGPSCKDPKKTISYAANVERIVENKCQDCHSVKSKDRHGAPDDTNYDTYAEMKKVANDAEGRVNSSNMPPSTADAILTASERETFVQWVACGAKP